MTGTLVNAAAIAAGGCVGLLLKKGVKGSHQDSINKALGVAVLVLGLNGVISSMFTVNADGTLASSGELLLIISLVPGTLAGEALRIDDRLNGLSGLVERRLHLSGFAQSFVNGALIYCVGAMAIIGALNDGLRGDASVLYIKSLLDGISSVVLGATLGPGVIFAALPVLVYQGSISLLAGALEPFLAGELLGQICGVGYCLVLCIGINFLGNAAAQVELLEQAGNGFQLVVGSGKHLVVLVQQVAAGEMQHGKARLGFGLPVADHVGVRQRPGCHQLLLSQIFYRVQAVSQAGRQLKF